MKGLRLGEDKISPSDLGVGRLEALLFSLYDGIDKLEGVVFEIPDAERQGRQTRLIHSAYRDKSKSQKKQNKKAFKFNHQQY